MKARVVDIRPGDVVRVKDPSRFLVSFAQKIRDRDAEVLWVGPTAGGMNIGRACIQFQKRNGRGKEFSEVMQVEELEVQERGKGAVQ